MQHHAGSRPYAKAYLDVLRSRRLTPAQKLVSIAAGRLEQLGEAVTPDRLAQEAGLALRSVQYALRGLGVVRGPGRGRPRAGKVQEKVQDKVQEKVQDKVQRLRKTTALYNNNSPRDLEGGRGEEDPRPRGDQGSPTETPVARNPQANEVAARMGGRFPVAEVQQHLEADMAAGAYTAAEVTEYLETGAVAPAFPSRLRGEIPSVLAYRRRAAWLRRMDHIHRQGLCDARHEDGRRGVVRFCDPGCGRLVIELEGRPGAGATVRELEDLLAAMGLPMRGSATEVGLHRRLEEVRAGRPDPAGPQRRPVKVDIRRPADMTGWSFWPVQPLLFAEGGEV